ncbi:MAG: DUF6491 family protein [Woeseiaceae bacterium]|nr:DUF6491 family protein [Woeseiaceae bacterium]
MKTISRARFLLPSLALLTMTAPAFADDEKKLESEAKKANACIPVRPRMYFQSIGNDFVYVESASDRFLMTMARSCPGLERGYNIRFKTKKRRVCSNSRAALEYEDLQITMPACRIRVIDKVEDWQDAQALMLEKKQAREAQKKKSEADRKSRD